jgi:LmbE family N-acetylglucosaminyl deacetylase
MNKTKKVLSLYAHPDDAEFICAGTLALLQKKGWKVHIATTANSNCGSAMLNHEITSQQGKHINGIERFCYGK